jgi:uncharacterized membrane protein
VIYITGGAATVVHDAGVERLTPMHTARRLTMNTKTKLALAALLVLGLASAAQAGSKDDADSTGGYAIGPLGHSFLGGNAGDSFGYVPPRSTIRNDGRCWDMTPNGNYVWGPCQ